MESKQDPDRALLGFEQTLWTAADKLRGSLHAGDYKHVVLGLIFLRYALDPNGAAGLAPPGMDWAALERGTNRTKAAATVVDRAMSAVESANPALTHVLPRLRKSVDSRRLTEVVELLGRLELPNATEERKDVLGRIYEYFLSRFASAGRSGEFYTPRCVVELLVDLLQPRSGSVYDPCCGSGGMFIQSKQHASATADRPSLTFFGQELNETTWKLARMNLALHDIDANLADRAADTFHDDLHPGLEANYVLANPPFNMSDWGADSLVLDERWRFGLPSPSNANLAWIQHILSHLAPGGEAGVVLANGSLTANQETTIRAALVRANVIDAVIALPNKLFYSTSLAPSVWLLTNKRLSNGASARPDEVLFVDATDFGDLVSRAHRELKRDERHRIADVYHQWRSGQTVEIPGFARSVPVSEILDGRALLAPARYTASYDVPDVVVAQKEIEELTEQLQYWTDRSAELDRKLSGILNGLGH